MASNFLTATVTGGSISDQATANTELLFNGIGTHTVTGTAWTNNAMGGGSSRTLVSAYGDTGAGSLSVINCTFSGTTGTGSSHTLVTGADLETLTISGSQFTNNTMTGPGSEAVSVATTGTVNITGSTFSGNSINGASINDCGSAVVSGSTFRDNRVGLNVNSTDPGTLSVTGTSFVGGQDNDGLPSGLAVGGAVTSTITSVKALGNIDGGIYLSGTGDHTVSNLLSAGNGGVAGGVWVSGSGTTTIRSSTIAGNVSTGNAPGGVYIDDAANLSVVNTILHGNSAPEIGSVSSGTVGATFSNVQGGFAGTGNIDLAPLYVDADGADNIPGTIDDDFRLGSGSAGINAGSNAAVPVTLTTDLAGAARVSQSIVDIGAYEFQGATCLADFDTDGARTIDDIFIFLNAWFAGCNGTQSGPPCLGRSADVDGIPGVSIDDIFVFINIWFAGCP